MGRGALLGPEESGLNPEGFWTVSSGSLSHWDVFWCGVVAGAGSHQTAGGLCLMGVLFPWMAGSVVCGECWVGCPARILRTV
jgi:hypothetical protein